MNPTHPQQLSTSKTVGSVGADKKVYFKGIEVYLPCLARAL